MTISESRRVGVTPVRHPKFTVFRQRLSSFAQWLRSIARVVLHPLRTLEEAGSDSRDTFFGFDSRNDD